MSSGYNTMPVERSANLSHGRRQMLTIDRAMIGHRPWFSQLKGKAG